MFANPGVDRGTARELVPLRKRPRDQRDPIPTQTSARGSPKHVHDTPREGHRRLHVQRGWPNP